MHRKSISAVTIAVISMTMIGLPVVVQAATANTTVQSVIGSAISISSNGTVELDAIPTGSGVQTIASDTVTVSTNDTAGYTLQLAENGASQNLVSGSNTLAPSSGSQTTPIAETANSWGYRVDGLGGFGSGPTSSASSAAISSIKFAAVPASGSPNTLKTTSATASNDTTQVWYALAVNSTQASGTYTNTVTYTATSN